MLIKSLGQSTAMFDKVHCFSDGVEVFSVVNSVVVCNLLLSLVVVVLSLLVVRVLLVLAGFELSFVNVTLLVK